MMDLKEIIKWFIPCFHILRVRSAKMTFNLTVPVFFLFLLFNLRFVSSANLDLDKYNNYEYMDDVSDFNETKYDNFNYTDYNEKDLDDDNDVDDNDFDDYDNFNYNKYHNDDIYNMEYTTEKALPVRSGKGIFGQGLGLLFGRTFGRPFKKIVAGLIPIVFQIGAASTWAVIAALVGVKTLAVALVILKLILLAGAAKLGALFGLKGHTSTGWETPQHPQKEIHLHIHNGQGAGHGHYGHDEGTTWNRAGVASSAETSNIDVVLDPYGGASIHGPQAISTPYGNYVKVDPSTHSNHGLSSKFYK